ncbi:MULTISPECIES: 4-hydroxybenzoate 3-monooxygenase [unclassified Pseudofrankia]|uniref:4-hydroxybenzoate 3-monooxygenase n=1 Tax=unclassified Pseudofrankia TaxID=2994372 RepID=UPI0008DB1F06|nr:MULTISPECIES: 4-hydroxybenzoate 3-monooxygenase [unclassified Pseudofrankia]MDT3440252.1 4-hydroxybenzoate 3-monooxygenase [Pseudofrankia sp. BMG5.37]OHV73531.1 4-hydroxybenzoate 3-monooxygenase [Pseudofrankia sp. BMG5.36]
MTRTQVGIVGAGPAGLLLSHLLHLRGIESVVLESRPRGHVEHRQRAGMLEQGTVDVLRAAGVGDRMDRVGLVHHGIELRFAGERHRIDFPSLAGGRAVMIYAQTEIVKDLVARRLADAGQVLFEAEALVLDGLTTGTPTIRYRHEGREHTLACDVIAACDGFHGLGRATLEALPEAGTHRFEREYPFAWLGILADVAPSCDELIYARHERGFALHSMRSATVSRLYLQVPPDAGLADWPDDRIWDELAARFEDGGGWELTHGPVTEKGITPMRSFVAAPMRHGRLFLAGDAAHIVPPTGAKGLNLAVADVTLLASALARWLRDGDETGIDGYSDTALRRVWRAEHFSHLMTTMLHVDPAADPFDHQLALSQLRYIVSSAAAAATVAENYVGLSVV